MLSNNGLDVLVLERLPEFSEKNCGGWITSRSVDLLSAIKMDTRELLAGGSSGIKRRLAYHPGGSPETTVSTGFFGFGTTRKNLNEFMARQASGAGTEIIFGQPVHNIRMRNSYFEINEYLAKKAVLAIGARKFDSQVKLKSIPAFAISEIVTAGAVFGTDMACQFFNVGSLLPHNYQSERNYFWIIPIGNDLWNIGMFFVTACKNMRKQYNLCRSLYVTQALANVKTVIAPRESTLGTIDFSGGICQCTAIGDFAGECDPNSGGGISGAIESGIFASKRLLSEMTTVVAK